MPARSCAAASCMISWFTMNYAYTYTFSDTPFVFSVPTCIGARMYCCMLIHPKLMPWVRAERTTLLNAWCWAECVCVCVCACVCVFCVSLCEPCERQTSRRLGRMRTRCGWHVCRHTLIYLHRNLCHHTHIYLHVYPFICVFVFKCRVVWHVYIYIRIYMYVYIYICMLIYVWTYVRLDIYV